MNWQKLKQPPWRTIVPGVVIILLVPLLFYLWTPGKDVRDGRHDRGQNGIWIGHGWLGGDEWFIENQKTEQYARFREPERIRELADLLQKHQITDVFPIFARLGWKEICLLCIWNKLNGFSMLLAIFASCRGSAE